jgi:hypothetical protein
VLTTLSGKNAKAVLMIDSKRAVDDMPVAIDREGIDVDRRTTNRTQEGRGEQRLLSRNHLHLQYLLPVQPHEHKVIGNVPTTMQIHAGHSRDLVSESIPRARI